MIGDGLEEIFPRKHFFTQMFQFNLEKLSLHDKKKIIGNETIYYYISKLLAFIFTPYDNIKIKFNFTELSGEYFIVLNNFAIKIRLLEFIFIYFCITEVEVESACIPTP